MNEQSKKKLRFAAITLRHHHKLSPPWPSPCVTLRHHPAILSPPCVTTLSPPCVTTHTMTLCVFPLTCCHQALLSAEAALARLFGETPGGIGDGDDGLDIAGPGKKGKRGGGAGRGRGR